MLEYGTFFKSYPHRGFVDSKTNSRVQRTDNLQNSNYKLSPFSATPRRCGLQIAPDRWLMPNVALFCSCRNPAPERTLVLLI